MLPGQKESKQQVKGDKTKPAASPITDELAGVSVRVRM